MARAGGTGQSASTSGLANGITPIVVDGRGAVPGRGRMFCAAAAAVMLVSAAWTSGVVAAATAPEGRGYELVSPQDKNGGDVERNRPQSAIATSGASVSGEAVAYVSQMQFAGVEVGAAINQYRSERDKGGWITRGISPPALPEPLGLSSRVWAFSSDLSKAVVSTNAVLTPSAVSLSGSLGLYLRHADPAFGYDLLSDPATDLPPDPDPGFGRFEISGATEDMSRVVFESDGRALTPAGPTSNLDRGVYVWDEGEVRFVSVSPVGEPFPVAYAGGARPLRGQFYPGDHVISEDGKRVYFTKDEGIRPLYVHERGSGTRLVSESEQDSAEHSGTFLAAKADDGSLALFTSYEKLTDDATACDNSCPGGVAQDLYLWNANGPDNGRLTDLTIGDTAGGGVLGLAAAADDMSRAYFVATGSLAAGGVAGQPNLYVWTPGSGVRHVATLAAFANPFDPGSSPDSEVWSVLRSAREGQFRDARVSDDGDKLLFTSSAQVTAQDTAGRKQVYLYDAVSDSVVCVSCPPDGTVPASDGWLFYPADLGPTNIFGTPQAPLRLPRNLSADGERVFFETAQALVDADTNGKTDVYMWFEGRPSLMSTGKGDGVSEFIDASASGNDVFFTTRERIVGWDTDDQVDVYDARVGGGFPEPRLMPECLDDTCRGPFSQNLSLAAPGSAIGPGDLRPSPRAQIAARRLSVVQRRALAAGRGVLLVVRVSRSGRIAAHGTARIGGRSRTVLRASGRARRAGKVRLPLRLSGAGRRVLSRSGRLRVSLSVRFAGEREMLSLGLVNSSKGGTSR